jgi:hypothetical protein
MQRPTLFKFIAYSLPILFFIFIELILRLFQYGKDYPLVIADYFNPAYNALNDDVSLRYFDSEQFKTTPQYDVFLKEKTPETFRIVVQGESTALGFPYLHGASFPRMLEHKLQMRYPNKNIEVINTALAATNSYTLIDLSHEVLKLNPDLIIISSGHNEYYGAFGVGSTQGFSYSSFTIRGYLSLKKIRLVQLMRKALIRLRKSGIGSDSTSTLMARMVKEKNIAYQSALYKDGLLQFRNNLTALLKTYKKHKIPVITLNQVCNLKDHMPFLSESSKNNIEVLQSEISQAIDLSNYRSASELLLHSPDSTNALLHYQIGQMFLRNQQAQLAKFHFIKAKEFDLLRFRAPEMINQIIKEVSAVHGVTLLDLATEFEAQSKDGITGNELFTEHVHPNLKGQHLIADVLFKHIIREGKISGWPASKALESETLQPLATKVDSLFGEMLVIRLKSTWPFKLEHADDSLRLHFTPKNLVDSLAFDLYLQRINWLSAMTILHNFYVKTQQVTQSLLVAQALGQEFNHFAEPMLMAGAAAEALNKTNLALYYYKKGFAQTDQFTIAYKIFQLSVDLKLFEQAKTYLLECSRLEPTLKIEHLTKSVTALQKLSYAIKTDSTNINYLHGLAAAYEVLGKKEQSEYYLRKANKYN